MPSERASCGRDFHYSADINNTLLISSQSGYDFVCLPIVHPRYQREFIESPARNRRGPLTRSDLILSGPDWSSLIVGKTSPWIQPDSKLEYVRKNSERALKQELSFARHLNLPAVMIPLLSHNCYNLARIMNENVVDSPTGQLYWMRVPLKAPGEIIDDVIEVGQGDVTGSDEEDTWQWFNTFRSMCNGHKRFTVALEITADLPSQESLNRWCGEPVKAAILPTSVFLTNKMGFPVLPRAHQSFIKRLYILDVQIIITGTERHHDKGIKAYQQYMEHLYKNLDTADEIYSQFARGYEDYLQFPLQPLKDNLESQTYEIFERDPVKYSQYQKAVYHALLDRIPEEKRGSCETVIMVVGAGRGPLVRASLNAAQAANCKVRVYAVEKNENAVVTLENYKEEVWGDLVEVVSCDMREWDAPERADILVSELLGSFGDNELSPECLDGAQRFLKADGISIPSEYTSYVSPLQSPKLYNEVRNSADKDKHHECPFETPFVVRLHNCHVLAEPQPLFTFIHPNKDEPIDNSRYKSLSFNVPVDTVMHGFAGYFYCILYKDINISIVPASHSKGMFSWFPVFFPLKDPVQVKENETVTVHYWRVVSNESKNVWYEWCITEPNTCAIHNPKGRSYTIGL